MMLAQSGASHIPVPHTILPNRRSHLAYDLFAPGPSPFGAHLDAKGRLGHQRSLTSSVQRGIFAKRQEGWVLAQGAGPALVERSVCPEAQKHSPGAEARGTPRMTAGVHELPRALRTEGAAVVPSAFLTRR